MIDKQFLTKEYYLDKLSLILKNTHGIEEDIAFFVELHKQIEKSIDNMSEMMDIFNEAYLTKISDTTHYDILDRLGALYNVTRQFSVTYEETTYELNLNDEELLMLIKAMVIKNRYKGTYEEQQELFKQIGLPIYQFNAINPAECDVYLDNTIPVSENIQHMFLAGLFTLTSMGINYNFYYTSISNIGVWDVSNWDEAIWS